MLVWSPAWAVKVTTLYEVEVPVASQASNARAAAIREGLEEVLVRLTGDHRIVEEKAIINGLNKADYYVQEYAYSTPDVHAATYMLNIKFNQRDVSRLLRKAGMKQWGSIRPLVLVWLATISDQHQVDILGVDMGSSMLERFRRQGKRFGLPLIFPMMDMADMNKVSAESITSVVLPELKSASDRYEPDALLIGTIEYDDDAYQGRWSLVISDKTWDWTTSGATQEEAVSAVLEHVSQLLSRGRMVVQQAKMKTKN